MTKATEAAETAVNKPFDLGDLDTAKASDNGARIELVHPVTKEGVGLFFTVLGKHSHVFRDIIKERVDKRIKAAELAARRGKPAPSKTADEAESQAIELLVACTTHWDSGEGQDYWLLRGEKLPFNVPNAIKVYTEILWIREQVDEAIDDLENFIKA